MESAELVAHMYHSRGYDPGASDGVATHPGRVTLVACNDEGVFGTLTVCVESPFGLPADAVYGAELAPFRLAGRKLMELTALAVRPEHGSRTLLGALFHFAHIYGTVLQRATDVFIEVNPRHVDFYERMLNFRQAGPQKNCPRVQAPAILLHLETAHVSREVAERITTGKSLYPCFFSADEERSLARRMRRITKDEPMRILNPPPVRLYTAGSREPR